MIEVYGLNNCDTCRKARKWLAAEGVEHEFHDIRKANLDDKVIAGWAGKAGWETLLNRRGMTWRGLPAQDKESVDEAAAIKLMTAHPALIKRPVFVMGSDVLVGFTAGVQEALTP